jgi:hypothetical protein
MVQFATALKQLPAQVLEHTYSYSAMGTWTTTLRFRGIPLRVLFDGREGEVRLERSASRKPPYDWQEAGRHKCGDGRTIASDALLDALRSLVKP